VRGALSQQIAHGVAGLTERVDVLLLEPVLEDTIRAAICQTAGGSYLALDPQLRLAALHAIAKAVHPLILSGKSPVILTSADIRRYVRKLVEVDLGDVSVISFQELPPRMHIQPVGRVSVDALVAA
jgi:type III secretion protein V